MKKSVRVIQAYAASNPDPLNARASETLLIGKRDDEWPGWIWCTDPRGKSAWVHEDLLRLFPDQAVLKEDYAAVELSAGIGETLIALRELGGWLWCKNSLGQRGWIPERNTEDII